MKNKQQQNNRKSMKTLFAIFSLVAIVMFAACTEDVGDKYRTYEQEQIASFLEKDPGTYSLFTSVLKASGMWDLLNTYGTYTCFAPTNTAMETYFRENGLTLETLTDSVIREISFQHLLPIVLESQDFPEGAVPTANYNERFLYINTVQGSKNIVINDKSPILILDQVVHNGVVHTLGRVLENSKVQIPEVLIEEGNYALFCEAMTITGMGDSLRLMKDDTYEQPVIPNDKDGNARVAPQFRKYGYTIFVESDETLANTFTKTGKPLTSLEALREYAAEVYDEVYPEDAQYFNDLTDRRNSLNRFVSYHLLDRQLASNEFITAGMEWYSISTTVLYEYIETMCPNTLIEVRNHGIKSNIALNWRTKNTSDPSDDDAIYIIKSDIKSENGVAHEIDRVLVYDKTMETDVLNKRLRMEIASFFPELSTNKVRYCDANGVWGLSGTRTNWTLPRGYLKYLTQTEGTAFHYWGDPGWRNYQGDEFWVLGKYDFTFRTAPVPAGTYEVRLGYQANGNRGVAQIYVDGKACGIPLDMTIGATNAKIGWEADTGTADNPTEHDIENDKMMRNRGYLKGPNTIWVENHAMTARQQTGSLRRVLVTRTFDKTEPHTIRIKSVEERTDREFHLDFVEFVPSNYWEKEGRD
jgi:uncharacterized surface protein with fasciclin (FAS1) repeats